MADVRQVTQQAAIERSAREWTLTFDALAHPIFILDEAGIILRLNEAARSLAGVSHRDILGRPIGTVAPGDFWARAGELVQTVRTEWKATTSQVRSDKDKRTWNIELTPVMGFRSGSNSLILIAHDITMTVRLQESLRRSETMAAMGALIAGVAHEVRNPLFGMTATLEAFEAQHAPSPAMERHVATLRAQLNRLKGLMQELLEYGRPPSLDLRSVPFSEIVNQVIEATEHLARERGVGLDTTVETALPPVRVDRMRLVQVIVNMVTNAVQHSPDGGRVTVRAFSIQQGGTAWLETVVEDVGPGIDLDDLPHVFEPFYTRRAGGTGLGLALVQRIVEQHGGTVAAENRPNGGALVRFRLPL